MFQGHHRYHTEKQATTVEQLILIKAFKTSGQSVFIEEQCRIIWANVHFMPVKKRGPERVFQA